MAVASSVKQTVKSPSERQRIKAAFLALPDLQWSEKKEQYCDYRLDGKSGARWVRAKQFTNGTLYLEASDSNALDALQQVAQGGSATLSPAQVSLPGISASVPAAPALKASGELNITGAYAGTDESGKGDYFGPLVIAGVYVTEQTMPTLLQLGVMDSKKLTDKTMAVLSAKIIETVGESAISIVEIGPKKYNELYDRMKANGRNLNHLLAWGHATVIENLLEQCPECTQVIADQFGNERYIQSQLKERGKQIKLYQTHRAEANIGVAAASILARHRFVSKMQLLSQRCGVNLPMGASALVKKQAKIFVQTHGFERLGEVAKLHFKTTQELM